MRKSIGLTLTALMLGGALTAAPALAQEETGSVTRAEEEEVTRGYFKNEVFGIRPQLGIMAYQDALGQNTSRAAEGLTLDWNLTSTFGMNPSWYFGPSTGLIYSHLGAPTSNFFGTDPDAGQQGTGANMFIIPANLKVGYNVTDKMRVAVHGGGNGIYRSVRNSMDLGPASSIGTDSIWKIYPNVGADFEVALSRSTGLAVRPDLMLTPGEEVFIGTVALAILLG